MTKTTRATQTLAKAGIAFTVHAYAYDPGAERIGLQAAEALGVAPGIVLKTLMAQVTDGPGRSRPVCVILPSDREVSMKKLAAAFAGKSAEMMAPADAERLTGYRVGGISPLGQKRPAPAALDASALEQDAVFVNAGQRGLQLRLDPRDLKAVLGAVVAPLTA